MEIYLEGIQSTNGRYTSLQRLSLHTLCRQVGMVVAGSIAWFSKTTSESYSNHPTE
jgi:hypothetical protein